MASINPQQGLMPSLLDRLIDPEAGGTAWRHGYSVEQMVEAVHRDLEDLLNTRLVNIDIPEDCPETRRSLAGYGLPDLASLQAFTPEQRAEIGRILEATIARFEPRLRDVRATLVNPGETKERTIRFRIDARLCVEPAPEVAFDTILELSTGHSTIERRA
ncbi:MAG TPA: type VI secretion system baseplate subunit TssE [Gemmataceae bacterium]|nr:type VI secretion system baseplate subunit TssE [Gemmataceae bacterium]